METVGLFRDLFFHAAEVFFFFCGYNYYYEHRGLRILCIIFLRDWICRDSNYTLISFFFFFLMKCFNETYKSNQ